MLRDGIRWLASVDEVGRGALAGPVSVGVVLVDLSVRTAPRGLKDSKLLTPALRERLAPRVRRWAPGHAVGHASAAEIDEVGILCALRLAGERALAGLPHQPDAVLLDGNYDWLTKPAPTLFDVIGPEVVRAEQAGHQVTTRIKADMTCAGVAAASVLAKTERDRIMVDLAKSHPAYGWEINKGYATSDHRAVLKASGPCTEHRRTWRLLAEEDVLVDHDVARLGLFEGQPAGSSPVGKRPVGNRPVGSRQERVEA